MHGSIAGGRNKTLAIHFPLFAFVPIQGQLPAMKLRLTSCFIFLKYNGHIYIYFLVFQQYKLKLCSEQTGSCNSDE
jgi:hypothetical protein